MIVITFAKYGITARMSMKFIPFVRNRTLLGEVRSRATISRENQTMQMVSVRKKGSAKSKCVSSSSLKIGRVSMQKVEMEMTITKIEMMETILACFDDSGYSIRSQSFL